MTNEGGFSSTITTSPTSSGDPELLINEAASSNGRFFWLGWIVSGNLIGLSSGNIGSNPDSDFGLSSSVGLVAGFGGDVKSSNIWI